MPNITCKICGLKDMLKEHIKCRTLISGEYIEYNQEMTKCTYCKFRFYTPEQLITNSKIREDLRRSK